jgi:release factor glutamine methyltransferase
MAHALGSTRGALLLGDLGKAAPSGFEDLISRRLAHEPVAYITGVRDFWTISLHVGPGVLVPRADSETLLEAAVEYFGKRAPESILDLGTGPGTLLLAALDQWPDASGVGVDVSENALDYARANAERLGMANRANFVRAGWEGTGERHDLILCNPPYVATGEALPREVVDWEPAGALFAGADGLDDYRKLARLLLGQLTPGGVACVEIGAGQATAVTGLFAYAGLTVGLRRDLAGRDRCLIATA